MDSIPATGNVESGLIVAVFPAGIPARDAYYTDGIVGVSLHRAWRPGIL